MTLNINGGNSQVLNKESTQKLFEAHIFSDFIGLKEDKPNGLIQVELDKRINTNSKQNLAKPWISWLFKSYGTFQYITPSIVFSKLEEHNKHLLLGDLDSIRKDPGGTDVSKFSEAAHRYTSAIEMFQYQSFSGGADINFLYLNNHDLKYNLNFDLGIRLGLTPVTDSVVGTSNNKEAMDEVSTLIPHMQFSVKGTINFLPEERFNLSISDRPIYFRSFNQNIQLLGKDQHGDHVFQAQKAGLLNVAEMLMTLQLSEKGTGKLFGRLRFVSDLTNMNSNFTQVQVGYSTFIIGSK